MTTVLIDTRSTEAKKMLEYLKTTHYAKVIEAGNDDPVDMVKKGLEELDLTRQGKLKGKSAKQFLSEI
ncbi:MAG TPA: hypothetical protein PKH79_13960 [Prolixibacteraceae bacterium]|nr:hypothetical protein [Prolixibacteraceae bacterium]HPS13588.1 hypothetical protein [Prolixibacteraceae bacterium]